MEGYRRDLAGNLYGEILVADPVAGGTPFRAACVAWRAGAASGARGCRSYLRDVFAAATSAASRAGKEYVIGELYGHNVRATARCMHRAVASININEIISASIWTLKDENGGIHQYHIW